MASSESSKIKNSKKGGTRYCCVVNCHENRRDSDPGIIFHSFPKEPVLRDKWTNAVKRINKDGSKWTPKDWTVILPRAASEASVAG